MQLRYWKVDHGPLTWVKATTTLDAVRVLVEEGYDDEEFVECYVDEVRADERMLLEIDGDARDGTMSELFGGDPRGVLASTEY